MLNLLLGILSLLEYEGSQDVSLDLDLVELSRSKSLLCEDLLEAICNEHESHPASSDARRRLPLSLGRDPVAGTVDDLLHNLEVVGTGSFGGLDELLCLRVDSVVSRLLSRKKLLSELIEAGEAAGLSQQDQYGHRG